MKPTQDMTGSTQASTNLERLLAALLQYGTWAGSFALAGGIALRWSARAGIVQIGNLALTVGVCIVIVLPVTRLMLMLAIYSIERDYRFASVAAFVLLIVVTGCIAGVALGPMGG